MNNVIAQWAKRRWRATKAPKQRADLFLTLVGWVALLVWLWFAVIPGLRSDTVFLGTDITNNYAPWSINYAAVDQRSVNPGVGDTVNSATPMALLITESVSSGHFPLWDPYTSGGVELGALPNSALLSPISLPWWVLPATSANAGVKLMEMVAIALGMYGLLRRQWRLPRFTVPLATLIFATSGFLVSWTNWPQTRVACLLPLFFWAIDYLAVKTRWRGAVFLGLVTASMLLGGFPTVLFYGVYTAIPYYFVRALGARVPLKHICLGVVRCASGLILGVALAAVQILPFWYFSGTYVNYESRSGYITAHLPFDTLATAIVPFLLGYPDGSYNVWDAHYVEGFSYIGTATFVLLLAALLLRPKRRFPRGVLSFIFVGLGIATVAIYHGGWVLAAIQHLPEISSSLFTRFRCVFGLLAACGGALGASAIYDAAGMRMQWLAFKRWPKARLGVLIRLLAAVGMCVLAIRAVASAEDQGIFSQMWLAWAALIICTIALAAVLVWIAPARAGAVLTIVAVIAFTAVSALSVTQRFWPLAASDTFYRQTATHKFLADNLGQQRYITVGDAMMPGTSTAYQLRSATGHGFISLSYQELLEQVAPVNLTPTYNTLPNGSLVGGLPSGILDRLGVQYVVADPKEEFDYNLDESSLVTDFIAFNADTALSSASYSGPMRGVQVSVQNFVGIDQDGGVLSVNVVADDTGEILTAADMLIMSNWSGFIPLAGEDIGADVSWHLELTLKQTLGSVELGAGEDMLVAATPARASADGMKLVHAGDALIFERLSALPRVRWSNAETVISDASARLAALQAGVDTNTVVLNNSAALLGLTGTTQASVQATDVNTDEIRIEVKSDGAGWVTIDDPLGEGGWSATVDGKPAQLVPADHAGVAVAIAQAGTHVVTLRYEAPGFHSGLLITEITGAALVCGTIFFLLFRLVRAVRARRKQLNAPLAPAAVLELEAAPAVLELEAAPGQAQESTSNHHYD